MKPATRTLINVTGTEVCVYEICIDKCYKSYKFSSHNPSHKHWRNYVFKRDKWYNARWNVYLSESDIKYKRITSEFYCYINTS
jgi:hypothetical protein